MMKHRFTAIPVAPKNRTNLIDIEVPQDTAGVIFVHSNKHLAKFLKRSAAIEIAERLININKK